MESRDILARVLATAATPPACPSTFTAWRTGFRVAGDPFAAALDAGLSGGRLAFAFAGGYQAALRCLDDALPPAAFAALLLSEGRRQRPEDLQTTLVPDGEAGWRLDGEKSWVTGGGEADCLLVVARRVPAGNDLPAAGGPVDAALVRILPTAAGVSVDTRPPAGMLDDLPHGRARFDGVRVDAAAMLPGDGWRDYGRPFRTLEDIHVSTAVAAHLAVHALRLGWGDTTVATLLACLARLADCAGRDVRDPVTHLLLAGAERELAAMADEAGRHAAALDAVAGQAADGDGAAAFARDWQANAAILALAAPARAQRLARALARLRGDAQAAS